MTAPHPDVISKALNHLADRSGPLASEYRWLFPSASTRTNRGQSTGGGNTHEDGSPTNLSDLLVSTSYVRGEMTKAGIAILEAVSQIHRAQSHLNAIQTAIDKGAPISTDRDERTFERPTTVGEVKTAKRYQAKRNQRVASSSLPWRDEEITG